MSSVQYSEKHPRDEEQDADAHQHHRAAEYPAAG